MSYRSSTCKESLSSFPVALSSGLHTTFSRLKAPALPACLCRGDAPVPLSTLWLAPTFPWPSMVGDPRAGGSTSLQSRAGQRGRITSCALLATLLLMQPSIPPPFSKFTDKEMLKGVGSGCNALNRALAGAERELKVCSRDSALKQPLPLPGKGGSQSHPLLGVTVKDTKETTFFHC